MADYQGVSIKFRNQNPASKILEEKGLKDQARRLLEELGKRGGPGNSHKLKKKYKS